MQEIWNVFAKDQNLVGERHLADRFQACLLAGQSNAKNTIDGGHPQGLVHEPINWTQRAFNVNFHPTRLSGRQLAHRPRASDRRLTEVGARAGVEAHSDGNEMAHLDVGGGTDQFHIG